jgi:hypothetical protein
METDVEINCIILLLNSRLTMLLGSLLHVFIVGSNAGQTTFRGKAELYWLPTPFACFPFTSPPVRHRVPPGFERATLIFSYSRFFSLFFKHELGALCSQTLYCFKRKSIVSSFCEFLWDPLYVKLVHATMFCFLFSLSVHFYVVK